MTLARVIVVTNKPAPKMDPTVKFISSPLFFNLFEIELKINF